MAYISYRELIQKLQTLQEFSNLLTEYHCSEADLALLRDGVEKQIDAALTDAVKALAVYYGAAKQYFGA
ncbi:MAG: hypothetical protein IKD72_03620 [Clostridia bacterium]|nr:hypothetical protein [Clostridia bacterium]